MHQRDGFTLLELSIVIVIIGLIVAGISAGQSLVKQASLRSVVAEVNQYRVALNSFKLQYDQLPGDMTNANSYWSGCGSGASAAECNGDGDGFIEFSSTGIADKESLRAWQHLSLAGLIDGVFTGESTIFASAINTGPDQLPFSKASGKYYLIGNEPQHAFYLYSGNYLILGGINTASNPIDEAFSVNDAKNIDSKMDDGIANAGQVLAVDGVSTTSGSCSAPRATSGGADYSTTNLGSDTLYCYLDFSL